jgi:hypothetical protein
MLDNSQSLDTFMGSVMDWERVIEEYERAPDDLFPMLIQKSTLAAKAQEELQIHLQMSFEDLRRCWKSLGELLASQKWMGFRR